MDQAYTGVDNLEVMEGAVKYRRFLTDLVANAAPPAGALLDFGAGTGTHALDLRERGFDVVCVEADARLCARLQASGFAAYRSVAEATEQPVQLAYSINVLEHIEDDAAALRQIASALTPGTPVVLYVPAFPFLFSAMDRKVGHHRRYRARPLRELVTSAGFRVTSVRYVDSLGVPATLVYKATGNEAGDISHTGLALYDRYVFPISRALDRIFSRWIGKNLLIVAVREE